MDAVQEQVYWEAVQRRDTSMEGAFVYAVLSTGIFCRPGCPSRRPRRDRVQFFQKAEDASQAGFQPCRRCKPLSTKPRIIETICRHIEEHLQEPLSLPDLGKLVHLSPFHLQRKFKAELGVTPREYADACRMRLFKSQVRAGQSVTEAIYEAGYGSNSRLYERSSAELGMRPGAYRRGGVSAVIHYTTEMSPLGPMLIAATQTGVCSIQFGDSDEELLSELNKEFPNAEILRDELLLHPYSDEMLACLRGQKISFDLPLDIRATAFQRLVWNYLRTIPAGTTESYSAIAKAIGRPAATRAVAGACAANRLAVAIPCHRVVPATGKTGGYRWGSQRKQKLLALENRAGH
jgi:AraC family transcriptional regulator, regulatory protein of adaptative response / methylated-DNA-[protein]-cysteine methyltransferase